MRGELRREPQPVGRRVEDEPERRAGGGRRDMTPRLHELAPELVRRLRLERWHGLGLRRGPGRRSDRKRERRNRCNQRPLPHCARKSSPDLSLRWTRAAACLPLRSPFAIDTAPRALSRRVVTRGMHVPIRPQPFSARRGGRCCDRGRDPAGTGRRGIAASWCLLRRPADRPGLRHADRGEPPQPGRAT